MPGETQELAKPFGEPEGYLQEFDGQARKLSLFGATDEQIAWFFNISLQTLAAWAWESESFFESITPSDADRSQYQEERKSKRKARSVWRNGHMTDPGLRLEAAMRGRIWNALKKQPHQTNACLLSRLDYSTADLRRYLEARFLDGMTWENYGKWHVDHIRPCALFDMTDKTQFDACWALSNLQPLWAGDNLRKGAKYDC